MSWWYYARSFTVGLLFNEGMTDPKTETSINCAAVHFHTNKFTLCFFTTVGKLKIDTVVHCVAELGVVRLKSGFLWGLQQLQHIRATFHVLEPPSTVWSPHGITVGKSNWDSMHHLYQFCATSRKIGDLWKHSWDFNEECTWSQEVQTLDSWLEQVRNKLLPRMRFSAIHLFS